jgi:chromosomal replication initiation ATPase DnaA
MSAAKEIPFRVVAEFQVGERSFRVTPDEAAHLAQQLSAFANKSCPDRSMVIIGAVAAHYGTTITALMSTTREHPIVWRRQVAMAALHQVDGQSATRIARLFGKDHGTVLHAIRMVRERIEMGFKLGREAVLAIDSAVSAVNSTSEEACSK